MVELSYYESLPDFMPQEDIERALEKLLMQRDSISDVDFLEALYELSSRQVNNYSLVNDELLFKLNQSISALWDCESIENTENCIAIITNLGLQLAYEHLKKEMPQVTNQQVKNELKEAFDELGESVDNVDDIR